MGEDNSSPISVDEARLAERVRVLVERGLERYGRGDLRGALAEWEHALALDPDSERAREYVDYVRANFDVLQATFDEAKEVARLSAELDVPFGLEVVGEPDDDDDYASIEVSIGSGEEGEEGAEEQEAPADESGTAEADASSAAEEKVQPRAVESVDEGWFLDDYADALPPPPQAAAPKRNLADELDAVPGGMLAMGPEAGAQASDGAAAEEPGPAGAVGDLEDEPLDESATVERAPMAGDRPPAAGATGDDEEDLGAEAPSGTEARVGGVDEFEDDEETVERSSPGSNGTTGMAETVDSGTDPNDDEEITVPGGEEPPPFSARVSFSQDALAALGPKDMERAPPEETTAERPGIVKRGITLTELEELDEGMRHDDRVLVDEEEPSSPSQVTFRAAAGGRHAWAGSLSHDPDDLEEEKTIERGATVQTDMDEELTVERRSDSFPTPAVIVDESLMTDEMPTVEQPISTASRPDRRGAGALDFGDADGDQLTRERPRDMGAAAGLRPAPGGEGGEVGDLRDEVLAHLDEAAPADESEDDRARRRVAALLDRARATADAGRRAGAVALLDLAMVEAPDNAAAQMVIHRHRDMLFDIYAGYIGDMNGVPSVARPMDELAPGELDNRAVFLLSRIDGTLSFEEVLDVAGMPRLEAYRVLCKMLLHGILEVR